jgi:peptidoglycan hydrolase-like protein with peptidoglycan-binding domain
VPEKQRTSAGRRGGRGSTASNEGAIGRLVDRACDNPAMSGGLFVMALTATAIVSNALLLQSVRHPEPLFATRPPLIIERHVPATPVPPRRDEQTGSIAPPLPRPAPIQVIRPLVPAENETAEVRLLREVQAELGRFGIYLGAVDGLYGELSRSAIAKYQKAAGLPVTGVPTQALLEHMKAAEAMPAPVPVIAAIPPAAAQPLPDPGEVRAEIEQIRYQRVQSALNRIGYGPVAVDGKPDRETENAIRRFQLDNGLPITGVAGEELVDRLVSIGALPTT